MGLFNRKSKEEKLAEKQLKAEQKQIQKENAKKHGEYIKRYGEYLFTPTLPLRVNDSGNAGVPISEQKQPEIHIMKNGISFLFKRSGLTTEYDFTEYRLVGVDWEEDLKIKVKKGHPIGRALVGGALFGGGGAVVGAMTSKDKSKVKKDNSEIVLTFQEVETGRLRTIQFKCDADSYAKWKKYPIQPLENV